MYTDFTAKDKRDPRHSRLQDSRSATKPQTTAGTGESEKKRTVISQQSPVVPYSVCLHEYASCGYACQLLVVGCWNYPSFQPQPDPGLLGRTFTEAGGGKAPPDPSGISLLTT